MTSFRRFLILASACLFTATSLSLAAELTWKFSFAPSDVSLTQRGDYTVISLAEGSSVRDAIGFPAIPARFANILLPDGATDVSVSATGELEPLASDIIPYPVQRVVPKSKPQPAFSEPDPDAYASVEPRPAAVATFEGLHEIQGATFASVRVNPLVYMASEKALYYRPTVSVTVSYTPGSSSAARSVRSASQVALASEMVSSLVVNPESPDSVSRARASARAASVDYLIITSSALSNAFVNLANYRATAAGGGYRTLVITTNTIASSYSGTDIQMKIRNCISNYVKTAGTTYVVLGGDDSVVPDRDCYAAVTDQDTYEWHMPTDLYYSDLTGTWKANNNTNYGVRAANVDMAPDVIVGRIPVRNASQLSSYLAKVKAFEADLSQPRNKIILGGPEAWNTYKSNNRPSDDVTGDGHAAFRDSTHTSVSDSEIWLRRLYRDGIYTNWSKVEPSITVNLACDTITSWDSSQCGDKELSANNLKTWLNYGYTHLMFSGHGYPQGWGMEGSANYSTSQASSQTKLVAFVYTDACLTGAFDEDGIKSSGITVDYGTSDQYTYTSEPCLGEAFIRNSSGGALVHMGCARYGWGDPNSDDGGPSTVYAYKFYNRLYETAAVSSNRTLGAAFAMSKADMISKCSTDDCERWIQFGLNFLGDPAIALYPRAMEDAAPEFSSATATASTVQRETLDFNFASLLTAGYPFPAYSLETSVSPSLYTFSSGALSFMPSDVGTYTFKCTASNTLGTADCTLTVTVTQAPPPVPGDLAVSEVGTTSFAASWSPAADATAYWLDVAEGSGPSEPSTALSEDFTEFASSGSYSDSTASQEVSSGTWTYENVIFAPGGAASGVGSKGYAQLKASAGHLYLPSVDNPATLSVVSRASAGALTLQQQVSGEWSTIASWSLSSEGSTYTYSFTNAGSATALRFIAGSKATYIYDVSVSGTGTTYESIPGYPKNIGAATSFGVTGLTPDTDYSVTVRASNDAGTSDWSPAVFATTFAADFAPVWKDFPPVAIVVGDTFSLDIASYVAGSPIPELSMTASGSDAATFDLATGGFSFTPASSGSYAFTFLATNTEGSQSATLDVAVTDVPLPVPDTPTDLATGAVATDSFRVTWSSSEHAASYAVDIVKRSGGTGTLLLEEDFSTVSGSAAIANLDSVTKTPGWSGDVIFADEEMVRVGKSKTGLGWIATPALSANGSVTVVWSSASWSGDGTTVKIAVSEDGELFTDEEDIKLSEEMTVYTNTFSASGNSVLIRWQCGGAAKQRFYLDDVAVYDGASAPRALSGEHLPGFPKDVGDVTGYTFTGLTPATTYSVSVQARNASGESDWSAPVSATTEEGEAAPSWAEIPAQTALINERFSIDLAAYVSGSPAPTLSVAGDTATIEGTVLNFTPTSMGTVSFDLTASNGVGDAATAELTVVVVEAPVTVPELTLSNPQATSFDADWTACTGATEYQFQVATDDQFTPGGGGGGGGEAVTETFANATFTTTTSSYTNQTITGCDLGTWTATSCRGDSTSPIIRYAGTLTSPSLAGGVAAVEFDYEWPYKESGTCDIDLYVNGAKVDSATVTGGESGTASYTAFSAVGGPATIEFRNTGTSNKRMQVTQVRITSASKSAVRDDGSLLIDTTTNGLSLTVTGLEPDTTYYARVRMAEGEWSTVESIATTGEGPAGPAKYAVCVGLSEYDMAAFEALGLEITPLKGCVNDATYLKASLTERGGWAEGNVALLTNGSATKDAIRGAIAAAAAKAKAGDTFVYEHSSHGLQGDEDDDYTAALATYDALYTDAELAEDLASFADGVKVVVLIDACHSGGMFGDGDDDGDAEPDGKARSAASFDIARRVSALMEANRAARKARGEVVSRNLTPDQIGWVTAATYEETSKDAGFYDTDEWISDQEAEDGDEPGGAFLASCAWGWWSGKADVSGEGDGDGWFDAYEGWSFSTPVCAEYNQTPQFLNEDVLRSVELGWVGETAPSEAIVFDPVPGAEVAIGDQATLTVVARNADGTTEGITLSIVATDPEELEYDFAGGTLAFTPEEDGLFLFTVQAVNGRTSATKILGVSAPLPAPVALEATDIDDGGFTANWTGVEAAQYYHLQVSTDGSFPEMLPDMLIEEGFDDVTNKASLLAKDWNFTGTFGTYASGGEAPPSIKLSSDKSVLTTPSFKLSGAKNGLSFWTKGFVSGTNEMTSVLTVQQCVGDPENEEDWETIEDGTFVPSTDGEPKEFENLDKDATRIRFVMAKASGNIAIDDVVVVHSTGGIVVDEEEIDGEETSFAVADLQPGTTYYYRVRAKGNTKSAWSETIEVTTTGEAPIPVPDLTTVISETDPDTTLFAFWLCTGVTEFRLQVATDAEFGALVYDEELSESIKTVTGLTPETTYYVRVCGLVGERVGDWSNVESVTTAPGAPQIDDIAIDTAAGTFAFTVKEGTSVETATDLVAGDWVPYEGEVGENGQVSIPMDDPAAYYRLVPSAD